MVPLDVFAFLTQQAQAIFIAVKTTIAVIAAMNGNGAKSQSIDH